MEATKNKNKGMDEKEYKLNKSLIEQINKKEDSPQQFIRKPF